MGRREKELRSGFVLEWDRGIAFAKAQGASAGALRALRALADADVDETMAVLAETHGDDWRLGRAVQARWCAWYPSYVMGETTRVLPELQAQWPGDRARRERQSERRQLDRWCSDGEDVLACLGVLAIAGETVRRKLRLQRDRFARLVAALVLLDAVRVWPDGRIHATAGGAYVREALRARWLGEGSDASDWTDPLPTGCNQTPNRGPTSDG